MTFFGSRFARLPDDQYFTSDPRCIDQLDAHFPLYGLRVLEPAAGRGDMVRQLEGHGALVTAFDRNNHAERRFDIVPHIDFLAFTASPKHRFDAVITNPPYMLSDRFIEHALTILPEAWVFMLMRVQWISTPGTRHGGLRERLVSHPHYAGMLPLRFRPRFYGRGGGKEGFAWFAWAPYPTMTAWPAS
jgi:hypothetical protein